MYIIFVYIEENREAKDEEVINATYYSTTDTEPWIDPVHAEE
jgi:hypothetical protein